MGLADSDLGIWLASTVVVFLVLCAALPAYGGEPPRVFEYLYVESNSGNSSGGHAAICFADRCYHFQQDEAQTIRLHKTDADEFSYRYRLLGNRTIHASRIEVSAATYGRLQSAFEARLRVQDGQYEVLESLVRDRVVLQQLLERRNESAAARGQRSMRVPGSAYFFADQRHAAPGVASHTERSRTLDRLAALVRKVHGSRFIERRLVDLRANLTHLTPGSRATALSMPAAGQLPLVPAGFATRYRELLSGWLALQALRRALPLQPASFHAPQSAAFALRPAEISVLRAYANRLRCALVQLTASRRPDWGYPLLVGMARLVALESSIASTHLVMLDDFPENAPLVSSVTVSRHAETLALVRDERRADFLAARRVLLRAQSPSEVYLSLLETTGNLFVDIDDALMDGLPMRVYSGGTVPVKAVGRDDWPVPELSVAVLQHALTQADERERTYRAALAALYPYDLISHNCVTEIFRTMEAALVPAGAGGRRNPAAVRATSRALLGGYVEWRHSLNFIPFLSAEAVDTNYRVLEIVERPSYRRLTLARMYRRESVVRVDLRESNVLTAESYERNPEDPIFLFFTDDVALRRPLYGIANLAVGLGGTLVGLALLPVDGGATLREGLNGALFSIPEIVFVNIRKGSFAFAPREWLPEEEKTRPLT